ncbi:hypothetical protein ABK040_004158 [Willaertia magna]
MINQRSSNSIVKSENNIVANHNTVPLNPSLPVAAPSSSSDQYTHVCPKHFKVTDIKCSTCNMLICYWCLYDSHLNHEHSLLRDITEKDRQEYIEMFNKSQENIRKRKLDLEQAIKDVKEKVKITKDNIKSTFTNLRLQLQYKEASLCSDVRNERLTNENQFLDYSLQQLQRECQLSNLNNLNKMDLEISKFKLQEFDAKINDLKLRNPLDKYAKFDFKLNKTETVSGIREYLLNKLLLDSNLVVLD